MAIFTAFHVTNQTSQNHANWWVFNFFCNVQICIGMHISERGLIGWDTGELKLPILHPDVMPCCSGPRCGLSAKQQSIEQGQLNKSNWTISQLTKWVLNNYFLTNFPIQQLVSCTSAFWTILFWTTDQLNEWQIEQTIIEHTPFEQLRCSIDKLFNCQVVQLVCYVKLGLVRLCLVRLKVG